MRIQLSDHFSFGKLLRFTFPSMVTSVFISLYGIVDGLFVTNFSGKSALAAINFVYPIVNILATFGYMVGAGGSALVAKSLGEQKKEKANQLFSLFVYLCAGLGLLLMIAGFFVLRPVLAWLGAEGALLDQSVTYGYIVLISLTFWNLQFLFQVFFVTAEKPKLGLYVTVLAGVTNMVLDALFIAVFKWGLVGAAAAYGIMMYVSMIFTGISLGYVSGSAPIVAYHYGAEAHGELKNLLKKGVTLLLSSSVAMYLLSILLANPLAQIFAGYDEKLYAMTLHGFRIFSVSFLFMGLAFFGSSFFTALNNGLVAAILSFLRTFVFQVASVLLLPLIFDIDGIWGSAVVAQGLAMLCTIIFLVGMRKKYHYA